MTSSTQQTTHHSLQHPIKESYASFLHSFSSSSPSSTNTSSSSSSLKYFPISFLNESLWDLNSHLDLDSFFNQSSFHSIENYFKANTADSFLSFNLTSPSSSSSSSSSSGYHRPYLTFVQNQTANLWKNVNEQFRNFKFYQYSNWNVTESSNSSASFESQLVRLFVSKSQLDNSRTNLNLRGDTELEGNEEKKKIEEKGTRKYQQIIEPLPSFIILGITFSLPSSSHRFRCSEVWNHITLRIHQSASACLERQTKRKSLL